MNSITFKILDPNIPGSAEKPSPYVSLENPSELQYLQDPDEIVINGEANVRFSYPFSRTEDIMLAHPSGRFTRADLARAVAEQYQHIYDEEQESTILPIESIAERNKREGHTVGLQLMNRACTDGVWGIWGHDLGDLVLHTVTWDPTENVWTLGIDS